MIHLHTYSHFSFLQGLNSPLELAQAASRLGMPALALTDTNMLVGSVEFYDACISTGIKPILGLELSYAIPHLSGNLFPQTSTPLNQKLSQNNLGNVLLYAIDQIGWSNLCRLSSLVNAGELPSIEMETLARHNSGLLCLINGQAGLIGNLLAQGNEYSATEIISQFVDIFQDRLYWELLAWPGMVGQVDLNAFKSMARLAKRLNLQSVPTVPVYYVSPDQGRLQKVIAAVRLAVPIDDPIINHPDHRTSHMLNPTEFLTAISGLPVSDPERLVSATVEFGDRCNFVLPVGSPHYPVLELEPEVDPDSLLRRRAEAGAIRLYGSIDQTIKDRLDTELIAIKNLKFAAIFLIMDEIIQFARREGVPISSRGSAASSLVAHCLGITSPDPIRLNLYFERFLNPMRATPPDIDTDLCSRRRDKVIQFVYQRFGQDRVAMVSTINRFRSRSALREVAKVYGFSPAQINKLLKKLPYRWFGPIDEDEKEKNPYFELESEGNPEILRPILADAAALIGLPHHLSIHPGGIIIAPGPLTDLVPTFLAPKGIQITQFDLESIERLGLLKMDLLGIRGLTVLGDVADFAYAQDRGKSASAIDFLENIPGEDAQTADIVRHGKTIGCFQIESPGMRNTLREIQAANIDDIMAALALYRPGPLTGGLAKAFIERFRDHAVSRRAGKPGSLPDVLLHPALNPILGETYGVILYQEQVLRIANELAGFSLADADLLRRAMSHFDIERQMVILKEKFTQGAFEKSRVPEDTAEKIWEMMAAFAGYGFPKAHAASYAQVAWRSAWCKQHYPAVFMAAVLANWGGYYSQRVYLSEARRMGLDVQPPHINYSLHEFSVVYRRRKPVLYMGLGQVRDLTQRTENRIIQERPFRSLSDFLVRVDPRLLEAENLIKAGSMDGFGNEPALLSQLVNRKWLSGQPSLFSIDQDDGMIDVTQSAGWSLKEKMSAQEQVLGLSPSIHPLDLIGGKVARLGALPTVDAQFQVGRSVRVIGMRQTWRRSRGSQSEVMYYMTLEDLDGTLNIIIPASVYAKHRQEMSDAGPYLVEGTVEQSQATADPHLRAARINHI